MAERISCSSRFLHTLLRRMRLRRDRRHPHRRKPPLLTLPSNRLVLIILSSSLSPKNGRLPVPQSPVFLLYAFNKSSRSLFALSSCRCSSSISPRTCSSSIRFSSSSFSDRRPGFPLRSDRASYRRFPGLWLPYPLRGYLPGFCFEIVVCNVQCKQCVLRIHRQAVVSG